MKVIDANDIGLYDTYCHILMSVMKNRFIAAQYAATLNSPNNSNVGPIIPNII